MTVRRMDNIGRVVESLDAAIAFFTELGLELSRFLTPPVAADHRTAPVNALGYLRVMFADDDLEGTLARLRKRGAKLVGEVVQYEDVYRLCFSGAGRVHLQGGVRARAAAASRRPRPPSSRWRPRTR